VLKALLETLRRC